MEHCRLLQQYAKYVAKVREYAIQMDLNDAVEYAIEACIKEGVLVDFLRGNRSEVKMLSILEYDEEWEKKKLRQTEYEAGREEGLKAGREAGVEQGEQKKLIAQVCRKLQKGYSVEEIADMLEEKENIICEICKVAEPCTPDYEIEQVWSAYSSEKNGNPAGNA